jgi:Xaa-Pro dipeptidase
VQENQAFTWNPSLPGTKSEDTVLASSRGLEMITRPVLYPIVSMTVEGIPFSRLAILEK